MSFFFFFSFRLSHCPIKGESGLFKAICIQDTDKVKLLLASGKYSINGDNSLRELPIIVIESVFPGYSTGDEQDIKRCAILKLLVQPGADINVQLQNGRTAAICASAKGYLRCLQFMVSENSADLSVVTHSTDTALTLAVKNGHANCVKFLLEHISASTLHHRNWDGQNALIIAASLRSKESFLCLQFLTDVALNLEVEDRNGHTAFMLALINKSSKALTLLLKKGAVFKTMGHRGDTPLYHTIKNSNCNAAIKLLRMGLDPALSRRDRYCLHISVAADSVALVHALVMNGFPPLNLEVNSLLMPYLHINTPTRLSPLAVSIVRKRPRLARYLIAKRFFTRYDLLRLGWNQEIRKHLLKTIDKATGESPLARTCLQILDFLSSSPPSLRTQSIVAVSSALSADLALDFPENLRNKTRCVCSPTFREKVELLELPRLLKIALLHQLHSCGTRRAYWEDIPLEEEGCFPKCYCGYCQDYINPPFADSDFV